MKAYLGDSVYAATDGAGCLVLTTENGYPDDPRNRIVLEPEVYQALVAWVRDECRAGTLPAAFCPAGKPTERRPQ